MVLVVTCPTCGSKYGAKESLKGRVAKCKKCGGKVPISAPKTPPESEPSNPFAEVVSSVLAAASSADAQASSDIGGNPCPACRKPMKANAILCTACGYDTRVGRKRETHAIIEEDDVSNVVRGSRIHSSAAATALDPAASHPNDAGEITQELSKVRQRQAETSDLDLPAAMWTRQVSLARIVGERRAYLKSFSRWRLWTVLCFFGVPCIIICMMVAIVATVVSIVATDAILGRWVATGLGLFVGSGVFGGAMKTCGLCVNRVVPVLVPGCDVERLNNLNGERNRLVGSLRENKFLPYYSGQFVRDTRRRHGHKFRLTATKIAIIAVVSLMITLILAAIVFTFA